ncbi:MAG: hypothetical protein UR68_C0011G0015 [Candidatus Roizmanbacteria bacterium GW2011_GWA2_35_19]|uniref:Uncharacterized protein n=2 Tax=Candidatus Roizmaniibacteriota TaxID=1752723 RepID=A0A0G0EC97_9BACT|nr:MAG: hypothetical protein UR63_C0019G0005 [Candidatus Roizmanbacteria bacterium GW2011_GWC2_35_12]KKP72880.1 MAG: hypothetical protein UR68_C0011G0015 [Candidatus Roizmanbacteria bacterium GW2011_GWA2_35_19]
MNKIYIFIFCLVLFLFASNINVSAQQSYFLVPGVNCGVAGDIKTNKCCAPIDFEGLRAPDLGAPFKVMTDLIFGVYKNISKGVSDPLVELQNQMLVACQVGSPYPPNIDPADINCRCEISTSITPGPIEAFKAFCENQTNGKSECLSCINGGGVWSALGCVQGSLDRFIGETIFGWGIGLAGGLALLCIIYAAFLMQSSQGNPEKLKKAQEMITSCIMGLMLIIFSVFILRLIGVNILSLPGFL